MASGELIVQERHPATLYRILLALLFKSHLLQEQLPVTSLIIISLSYTLETTGFDAWKMLTGQPIHFMANPDKHELTLTHGSAIRDLH